MTRHPSLTTARRRAIATIAFLGLLFLSKSRSISGASTKTTHGRSGSIRNATATSTTTQDGDKDDEKERKTLSASSLNNNNPPQEKRSFLSEFDEEYNRYFVGTLNVFRHSDLTNPQSELYAVEEDSHTIPYPRQDILVFVNRTLRGHRFYQHTFYVYAPVGSSTFCQTRLVPESRKILGTAGRCGVNGQVLMGELFGIKVATQQQPDEDEGGKIQIDLFQACGHFYDAGTAPGSGSVAMHVFGDGNTSWTTMVGDGSSFGYKETETTTFHYDHYSVVHGQGQYFCQGKHTDPRNPISETYTFTLTSLVHHDNLTAAAAAHEFETLLLEAYRERHVAEEDQVPATVEAPQSSLCVDQRSSINSGRQRYPCPTEATFRQQERELAQHIARIQKQRKHHEEL